jgi:lipoate-protein ligase A
MATDAWLFRQVHEAIAPSLVLRFYQWDRPTLSLGQHQRVDSLPNLSSTRQLLWVRRPTGGRAVLHQASGEGADLTYCIVAKGLGTHRRRVYEHLCQFLHRGFARLGIDLTVGSSHRGYVKEASCFRSATSADLCWQQRKLVGSAQYWQQGTVLQHGTILLQPDRAFWERVLPGSSQGVVGANEIASQPVAVAELVQILTEAASESFGIERWQRRLLSPHEQAAIAQLSADFNNDILLRATGDNTTNP